MSHAFGFGAEDGAGMSLRSTYAKDTLRLRLFVAGEAPNSAAALRNLRSVLAAHPSVPTELEIIDVLKHPARALDAAVLVTPTMIKLGPVCERRIIGKLSDPEALRALLGLERE